jgi:hypothetical protein
MKKTFYHAVVKSILALAMVGGGGLAASTLEEDFQNPPAAARPMVWWHWMGHNISREGITKDLEAMKAAGIGGATIFNLTSNVQANAAGMKNTPWPENDYRSPAWWALVKHAASEADRLGLNLGMHNCVGYSATGGPWITPEKSMKTVIWTVTPVEGDKPFSAKLAPPKAKLDFYREIAVVAIPDAPEIPTDAVKDLSGKMAADGTLRWEAPAGKWLVYRLGYTATGVGCHPAPEEVKTLECDKLSAADSKFHFEQVMQPMKENLGPLLGKSMRHLTLDSYEAGGLNWTENFRAEFQKRRGYNPVLWLPTLDKKIIGSVELSARFAWDLKTTVSDLFVQNNFRQGRAMMNAMGLQMYLEPYSGPFNTMEGATVPDITMGEFWLGSGGEIGRHIVGPAQAAGIKVIATESFTATPNNAAWTETPAKLKASGDGAWSSGINLFFLHHWVHQPFPDNVKPGMSMGWWGTHFGRNQTWYEPGKAWLSYLGRSQALLQRGEPVSDFLAVDLSTALGPNRADTLSVADFVALASWQNGRIVLPSGRSYAFLQFPNTPQMLLSVARKLKELVSAGAIVVGPKPERSPSLQDYPKADAEVAAIGQELWGATPGPEHVYGKGRMFEKTELALAALKLGPDFSTTNKMPNLRYTHRREGSTDIYFVTSWAETESTFTAVFRTSGKIPELWDSERGTRHPAPVWRQKDGGTEVDLTLPANTSVFVIFQQATTELASVPVPPHVPFPAPLPVAGPWKVHFTKDTEITLPTLASWTLSDQPAIQYFSGTATYRQTIEVPSGWLAPGQTCWLDLGDVRELARVRVNGTDCGVAWHAPFRVPVEAALKPGSNVLEIEVTNTWANRQIGDEREALDCVYSEPGVQHYFKDKQGQPVAVGRMLLEFPDWLVQGKPRPSQRQTFCNWNYFTKDSPLLESGLLGPVVLRIAPGL